MPAIKEITKVPEGPGPYTGVRVVWSDPTKGTQTYDVSQLPNNLTTAAAVESYMNTFVNTTIPWYDGVTSQTRIGAFLTTVPSEPTFAWVKVKQFTRNVSIDFDLTVADYPILSNPF